jgi:SAM-dependent methyltransferase
VADVKTESAFWDTFAPDLATIEDSFFDRRALRDILPNIEPPVLVVGAGQGLLVSELTARGMHCDGIDFSSLMIRYAKIRRNLDLIRADAKELPVADHAYRTVIYATGVIDFVADESLINGILREGRRVVAPDGRIFVGFYRSSAAIERFLLTTGLLKDHVLFQRATLEMYLWTPMQTVRWAAKQAGVTILGAAALFLRMAAGTTLQEKRNSLRMQKLFRNRAKAKALIESAPETVPYRNEQEVRNLFKRLSIPIKDFRALGSCWMVQI